jgi:hypothetical protein
MTEFLVFPQPVTPAPFASDSLEDILINGKLSWAGKPPGAKALVFHLPECRG